MIEFLSTGYLPRFYFKFTTSNKLSSLSILGDVQWNYLRKNKKKKPDNNRFWKVENFSINDYTRGGQWHVYRIMIHIYFVNIAFHSVIRKIIVINGPANFLSNDHDIALLINQY